MTPNSRTVFTAVLRERASRRRSCTVLFAFLLSATIHGQSGKSTVPDLHLEQQKTVAECRREIEEAGLQTGVMFELGDSPFFDDFLAVRQFPRPGEELSEGHVMHLAVSPIVGAGLLRATEDARANSNSPFAESTWTIVALVELILILVLIFLLVITKMGGARA